MVWWTGNATREAAERRGILHELLSAAAELLPMPQRTLVSSRGVAGQPGNAVAADSESPGEAPASLPPLYGPVVSHARHRQQSRGAQVSVRDEASSKAGADAALLLVTGPGPSGSDDGLQFGTFAKVTAGCNWQYISIISIIKS